MSDNNVDVSAPKPKVNGDHLKSFVQKHVTLLVERTALNEYKACDGTKVSVEFERGLNVPDANFVEVEGLVVAEDRVKATKAVSFGDNVDMFAYNEMAKMMHEKAREMIL